MIEDVKRVDLLQVSDLQRHPVWQYTGREGFDETFVRPAIRVPVLDLNNSVLGTEVRLANGRSVWALLGNFDARSASLTDLFLTVSVDVNGAWFHLARYFDYDRDEAGPAQLAFALGLTIDEVFPISYDVRQWVAGESGALAGLVHAEPREKLPRSEIIKLAVPK